MNKEAKKEKDLEDIWRRIKTRDFSGNTGIAIKNSIYQFLTVSIDKLGSFLFIVILARLLMPELFGLYSLTLSTIIIFSTISELGINQTIVRFISKELGKKKNKAKSYLFYFGKVKAILILTSSILLLISARFIAEVFYEQPIFMALLAGILYILFIQITGFMKSLLYASNIFKSVFKKEIIFQISRIVLVPLVVFFAIKYSFSNEFVLMFIILFLSISFLLTSLFLFFDVRKNYFSKTEIKNEKVKKLSKKQNKTTNKFIFATAALVLSGVFFANIDRVMLGRFVEAEFIGYYTAASSLITALTPLIGFAAIALLPIFSRLKGKKLEKGFKKSIKITLLFSTGAFLVTMILAYLVILVVYGSEYLLSINILRILSVLLFVMPLVAIYKSYYISQGNPEKVTKILLLTTLINIVLNYILIISLIPYGNLAAVYGVSIATLISKGIYLGGLVVVRRKK